MCTGSTTPACLRSFSNLVPKRKDVQRPCFRVPEWPQQKSKNPATSRKSQHKLVGDGTDGEAHTGLEAQLKCIVCHSYGFKIGSGIGTEAAEI